MLHHIVYNTSQVCYQLGVKHAVMSPGSRNAPLTISFARNENIKKFIIPDERAAGFIALGIAQKTKEPVVLCCTSGTALLNYAPAIAEAFYREIPLIVLSADRPKNLIDQRDGQTIRQFEVLKNHVKTSFQLPLVKSEQDAIEYKELIIKGLNQSQEPSRGPIHFNIPFKEPFYPEKGSKMYFEEFDIPQNSINKNPHSDFKIEPNQKILILIGQHDVDEELSDYLSSIQSLVPIVISPLNNVQISGIEHVDGFLSNQKELQPDVLITSGLSVLSKKLKNFIRKHKPTQHFHFDPAGVQVDTYNTDPQLIKSSLLEELRQVDFSEMDDSYRTKWKELSNKTKQLLKTHFQDAVYSEASSFKIVAESLPADCHLHLGNSMPVRFADLYGIKKGITTWSNRGTSGIDGCSSTAVGTTLVTEELNILFSGDVSFLYDRNAFFHNYQLPNLRIVVFNNQGGGIFRLIDGPANLPELEDYFETRHQRTAEYICLENKIEYHSVSSFKGIQEALNSFYEPSTHAKVLEVFTDPEINQKEYKKLKEYIHEHITR
jgi:2-succinyl-5-enolpyruvyl-6-hydroxy-3-cyclohexene-1-carboxylate synthase